MFKNLRSDFPASIVVFLVAVPLCLGIALASGAPLFSGIIAGIVGGIIVGFFSGSSLGVSGPAAGLAAIVLSAIQDLGAYETFLVAVVLAGVIQLLLGFAKAGTIAYYFPSSVIKGMLSGIGVIIILKQIPHAFGYDKDPEGDLAFIQPDGHNTLSELYFMLDYVSVGAIIITTVCLALLILWEQPFIKRNKVLGLVQGPLLAVGVGILLNYIFKGMDNLALASDQVVNIPVAESVSGFLGQFSFPDFSETFNSKVLLTAATLAIVASLETLLSVEATDKLDPQKRVTPTNQELKAQGIGNIVSGLIGGLPVTQVIVRSSANVQAGGKTKTSAILHGILMLVFVALLPMVLNMIPLASLAAILLMVGYKLCKPQLFKQMYKNGWSQFIPYIVTILGIVFTDLLIGVGLGLVVGIYYILYNNYKVPYIFNSDKFTHKDEIHLELAENVSFLNKASILQTLNHLPDNSSVIIDASKSIRIDLDVLEIIDDFKLNAATRNINVELKNFPSSTKVPNPLRQFVRAVPNRKEAKVRETA